MQQNLVSKGGNTELIFSSFLVWPRWVKNLFQILHTCNYFLTQRGSYFEEMASNYIQFNLNVNVFLALGPC